mgnify:CR=1 FL=1|jgi:SsrA-binding protein
MKVIASNRKARHDYTILDTYEAGIVLMGTEIKSVRATKVNISDSYVLFRDEEAYIMNMHIGKYKEGNIFNHDETRSRKLLLRKKEIIKINNKMVRDGLTCVPLKVYIDKGLCKLEIALAKGKKQHDKRHALKEKDSMIRVRKNIKNLY